MLNHGSKQSDRIIIEKPDLSGTWMRKSLFNRIFNGCNIEELWLKEGDVLTLFYKKNPD